MARLYRERADAENIYDELKNQWGWNGFTTQKLAPCRLMANLVALIYNWWHLYVRLYDGDHHREAITSQPAGLVEWGGSAGRSSKPTQSQSQLAARKQSGARTGYPQVSNTLQRFWLIAEHWSVQQRWNLLLTHIFRHWLGGKWLGMLPPEAESLLSG